jgi:hypothetical protein
MSIPPVEGHSQRCRFLNRLVSKVTTSYKASVFSLSVLSELPFSLVKEALLSSNRLNSFLEVRPRNKTLNRIEKVFGLLMKDLFDNLLTLLTLVLFSENEQLF